MCPLRLRAPLPPDCEDLLLNALYLVIVLEPLLAVLVFGVCREACVSPTWQGVVEQASQVLGMVGGRQDARALLNSTGFWGPELTMP